MSPSPRLPPAAGALLLAALAALFIVYGSLHPFGFRPLPGAVPLAEALRTALQRPPGSRGDLLANLVLYAPFGMALAAALARQGAAVAVAAGAIACAVLSGGMEVAQLFVPGRTSSIWDLVLNTAGGALGAAVAAMSGLGRRGLGPHTALRPAEAAAALLLACWLGYRFYPYVPTLDVGEWRASLRPLTLAWLWQAEPGRALRLAVAWLVALRLLEAAWPRAGLAGAGLVALGTVLAAIPLVDRRLTPAEVMAIGLALPAWALLRGRVWAEWALLPALLAVILAEGLAPYRFAEAPRPFGWIPFRSVLGGSPGIALQALLLKAFLYGGLAWLALRAGLRLRLVAPGVVLLALGVSLAQTWLPGRSAEVTDAVLAGVIVAVLWRLRVDHKFVRNDPRFP